MPDETPSSNHAAPTTAPNTLQLTNDQLIALLEIYSGRENFQISQHQARANFYVGLVVSGLAVTILGFAQYKDQISGKLILILPVLIAVVSELAIVSLKRTYSRVNEQILARYTIEQLLLLHIPTPEIEGVPYYFPGEPIRPLDNRFRNELQRRAIRKQTFHRHYSRGGQQAVLALLFRLAQLASLILAALIAIPSLTN